MFPTRFSDVKRVVGVVCGVWSACLGRNSFVGEAGKFNEVCGTVCVVSTVMIGEVRFVWSES